MRARFDANRDEQDTRKASILLADGCRQLWEKRHHKPYRFMDDPWGSNFDRYANRSTPDEVDKPPQPSLCIAYRFAP